MNQVELKNQIVDSFNKGELQNLCFELGINYENLRGETLEEKSRELVEYCIRRGKIDALSDKCSKLRPHMNWDVNVLSQSTIPKNDNQASRRSPRQQKRPAKKNWSNIIFWGIISLGAVFFIAKAIIGSIGYRYGDPIMLQENQYLVKLAGNETISLFEDEIEIYFEDKAPGEVLMARASINPWKGKIEVQSLGYPVEVFNLDIGDCEIYTANNSYGLLATKLYLPDSDFGVSDAFIELKVTKHQQSCDE